MILICTYSKKRNLGSNKRRISGRRYRTDEVVVVCTIAIYLWWEERPQVTLVKNRRNRKKKQP